MTPEEAEVIDEIIKNIKDLKRVSSAETCGKQWAYNKKYGEERIIIW